ncbi:uncharacterized protein VTP21DRAFT_4435 [Calcarisporiella thermophila]|uniref:uncharacterized protein n=1 Tax=Calcarisporiella thermophila TaxID=911321 RepID=UPI003743492F
MSSGPPSPTPSHCFNRSDCDDEKENFQQEIHLPTQRSMIRELSPDSSGSLFGSDSLSFTGSSAKSSFVSYDSPIKFPVRAQREQYEQMVSRKQGRGAVSSSSSPIFHTLPQNRKGSSNLGEDNMNDSKLLAWKLAFAMDLRRSSRLAERAALISSKGATVPSKRLQFSSSTTTSGVKRKRIKKKVVRKASANTPYPAPPVQPSKNGHVSLASNSDHASSLEDWSTTSSSLEAGPKVLSAHEPSAGVPSEPPIPLPRLYEKPQLVNQSAAGRTRDGRRPNLPRGPSDLYTPRWAKGIGVSKSGLCPLCPGERWFNMKFSAYWYHLHFFHGVSSLNGRPFAPPVAYRYRRVHNSVATSGKPTMKEGIYEGQCHRCCKWVAVESEKLCEVVVPEIYVSRMICWS